LSIAPLVVIVAAIGIALLTPAALLFAAPVLLLWLCATAITWWISRPMQPVISHLQAGQILFLRKTARRTWAFFEEFVAADDHWLPPDNFQEYRGALIAHRTSPTNMGMALLANLTAYDFGYLPLGGLLERTGNTLAMMVMLERYQGHFYNWYDTQSLQGLHPVYISSVDSGNLAGHLLVLRQGLLALIDQPLLVPNWLPGIRDTAAIVFDLSRGNALAVSRMQALLAEIEEAGSDEVASSLAVVRRRVESLLTQASAF